MPTAKSTAVFADLFAQCGQGPWVSVDQPWAAPYAAHQARGVTHRARRLRVADAGEVRVVHLVSDRAEILNAFAYPDPDRAAPTLALEFVRFGGRIVVAVIDLPWLAPGGPPPDWVSSWRDLWAQFADLPPADDPPEWFLDCRSGAELFSRPKSPGALASLHLATGLSWECWTAATFAAARMEPAHAAAHAASQQHYRDHHREHSPGRPFLVRTFGEEWTEGFLDLLFG